MRLIFFIPAMMLALLAGACAWLAGEKWRDWFYEEIR